MIVGGMLGGFIRARRIAERYVLAYFAVGIALIVLGGFLIRPRVETFELVAILCFGHFWLTALLFPMAVAANLVFVRLFRKRTWRGERWRSWIGGGLGVVLTWGGMVLVGILQDRPPEVLQDLLGEGAFLVHFVGWFVLFSNLGLFLAWCIPSRQPSKTLKV